MYFSFQVFLAGIMARQRFNFFFLECSLASRVRLTYEIQAVQGTLFMSLI